MLFLECFLGFWDWFTSQFSKLEFRKIGRYDNHTMALVVRLVDIVAQLPNTVAVHPVVLTFKPWSKVSASVVFWSYWMIQFGSQCHWVSGSNLFSETELEKNNNLGKCCEFLKVDSGLTYSGTYELNKGMIVHMSRISYWKGFNLSFISKYHEKIHQENQRKRVDSFHIIKKLKIRKRDSQ